MLTHSAPRRLRPRKLHWRKWRWWSCRIVEVKRGGWSSKLSVFLSCPTGGSNGVYSLWWQIPWIHLMRSWSLLLSFTLTLSFVVRGHIDTPVSLHHFALKCFKNSILLPDWILFLWFNDTLVLSYSTHSLFHQKSTHWWVHGFYFVSQSFSKMIVVKQEGFFFFLRKKS